MHAALQEVNLELKNGQIENLYGLKKTRGQP